MSVFSISFTTVLCDAPRTYGILILTVYDIDTNTSLIERLIRSVHYETINGKKVRMYRTKVIIIIQQNKGKYENGVCLVSPDHSRRTVVSVGPGGELSRFLSILVLVKFFLDAETVNFILSVEVKPSPEQKCPSCSLFCLVSFLFWHQERHHRNVAFTGMVAQTKAGPRTSTMCKYFHLQTSLGCSANACSK